MKKVSSYFALASGFCALYSVTLISGEAGKAFYLILEAILLMLAASYFKENKQ